MTTKEQIDKQSPITRFGDKLHQWQPGESGNPGGRPKGRSIQAELRKLLDKGTAAEEIAHALLKLAQDTSFKGNVPALKELLDRTDGKVAETRLNVNVNVTPERLIEAQERLLEANQAREELLTKYPKRLT